MSAIPGRSSSEGASVLSTTAEVTSTLMSARLADGCDEIAREAAVRPLDAQGGAHADDGVAAARHRHPELHAAADVLEVERRAAHLSVGADRPREAEEELRVG